MTVPNEQEPRPDQRSPDAARSEDQDASVEAGDVSELRAALASAEARAAESKDLYLRALAEIENVRKRAARDIEQAHKFALERVAADLIGVKDSLELGLASAGSAEALREGTQATLKLFAKAFERAGLSEIEPQGQPFDPELHEAMAMQPSTEHAPNTVVQVVQKGYQLNGRLVRPARVLVTREP